MMLEQLAQLGMGIFALFICYLIVREVVGYKKKVPGADLKSVIENNTQAMEALQICLHEIEISQARLDQKLDELLRR